MKTFEEALGLIACEVSGDKTQQIKEFKKQHDEFLSKYREMIEEIRDNPLMHKLVNTWFMTSILEFNIGDTLYEAFVSGLIVGTEMTRLDNFEPEGLEGDKK